jgi:hypothetical protein
MKHSLATRRPGGGVEMSFKPVQVTRYPPTARKY